MICIAPIAPSIVLRLVCPAVISSVTTAVVGNTELGNCRDLTNLERLTTNAQDVTLSRVSYPSLLKYLVVADFKSDINRYFLGFFWWIAEPLMYVAVFYTAFSHFRSNDEQYIYFLIVGVTTWRWLAGSINLATNSIVTKKRIIGHFSVNPAIFTLSSLITQLLKYFVILGCVCALLEFSGQLKFAGLEWMLFWFASTLTCVLACALGVAFLVVYIPDLRVPISQALMLLMFVSGVIFPIDGVSEELRAILQFNPFVHIIEGARFVLMGESQGELPYDELSLVLLFSAVLVVGIAIASLKLATDIPKRVLL